MGNGNNDRMKVHFNYQGIGVSVQCGEPSVLAWLEENLSPSFRIDSGARSEIHIDCDIEAARFAELELEAESGRGSPAAIFSMDGHPAEYSSWLEPDGRRVAFDDELHCAYVIDEKTLSVRVLAGKDRLSVRIALLRLLREIVSHGGVSGQALHQHAAALSMRDSGILICGPKRAGKTTLLSQLLLAGGAYIANDRSIVRLDDAAGVELSGMPTVVSVRHMTTTLLGEFLSACEHGWHARYTMAELHDQCAGMASVRVDDKTKLALSPAQYCKLMGCQQQRSAWLRYLLFPTVDTSFSGMQVVELGADEIEQQLELNEFALSETVFSGVNQRASMNTEIKKLRKLILDSCLGYRVVLGVGAERATDTLSFLWAENAVA